MIKINLLPREERVRRTPLNTKMIVSAVGVLLVLGLMAYGYMWLRGDVDRLEDGIRQAKAESKRYDELAKQVEKFRQEKARLDERIRVIESLISAQSGPVRLMDDVSKALPNEVWLTSFTRTGKKLELSGIAFSNFSVAALMTNLARSSALLKNVDLVISEKASVENVPVERFTITAEIVDGKA